MGKRTLPKGLVKKPWNLFILNVATVMIMAMLTLSDVKGTCTKGELSEKNVSDKVSKAAPIKTNSPKSAQNKKIFRTLKGRFIVRLSANSASAEQARNIVT